RGSGGLAGLLRRGIAGAPVRAWAQPRGGRFVPPAGFHTLRRAQENFDRLVRVALPRLTAPPVVVHASALAAYGNGADLYRRAALSRVKPTGTEEGARGR